MAQTKMRLREKKREERIEKKSNNATQEQKQEQNSNFFRLVVSLAHANCHDMFEHWISVKIWHIKIYIILYYRN